MEHIGGALAKYEQIILEGFDPISAHGFTQVPNVVLRDTSASHRTKRSTAMLLSYAWHQGSGVTVAEARAKDHGISDRSTVRHITELEASGDMENTRRGMGRANVYALR